MIINTPFEITSISQTKPGDLIRIGNHSAQPFGLVIHEAEAGKKVIGVLDDSSDAAPYHIVYERDFICYRYHPGWVLHLDREAAIFGNPHIWAVGGAFHIGKSGPLMTFSARANDWRGNSVSVHLDSFEWDDVNDQSVAFPRWSIWASEQERLLPGSKPIFTFTATVSA